MPNFILQKLHGTPCIMKADKMVLIFSNLRSKLPKLTLLLFSLLSMLTTSCMISPISCISCVFARLTAGGAEKEKKIEMCKVQCRVQ